MSVLQWLRQVAPGYARLLLVIQARLARLILVYACTLHDAVLLADGEDVVDQPIEHQAGREVNEHDGENERQEHHDLCLRRIPRRGGQFLLEVHRNPHEQGEHRDAVRRGHVGYVKGKPEETIRGRKIIDPENKRRVAQLNGTPQNPEESEEYGDLDDHGKTPSHGVHLVRLIQGHHLPVHLFFIALVLFPYFRHERLDLLHLLHGFVALVGEGPEENLDQNGEEDDGYPVVLNKAVEKPQSIEKRLRDNVRPPEVDSEVEVIPQFFKDAHIPRPKIQTELGRGRILRRNR